MTKEKLQNKSVQNYEKNMSATRSAILALLPIIFVSYANHDHDPEGTYN